MPTVHPLPVNPTTGQQPLGALRGSISSGGQSSSGGVNREVLKQLQDVAWSDEEVGHGLHTNGGTSVCMLDHVTRLAGFVHTSRRARAC